MSSSMPMDFAVLTMLSAPTAWATWTKPVLDETANACMRDIEP